MTRLGCLLAGVLLLSACASDGPASERGFFTGLGAAVSGQDEANAQRLEQDATRRQRELLEQRLATNAAQERQRTSEATLRELQGRWQALEAQLNQQRAQLARLIAQRGARAGPEGQRLQGEIEAADRQRAQAQQQPGGPSERELREIQERVDRLGESLRRYQGA